jgi:hypothetical protein
MKLTCKLELESHGEYRNYAELTMYDVHTIDDMKSFLNTLQKLVGFCGKTVKLVDESEE